MNSTIFILMGFLFLMTPVLWAYGKFGDRFEEFMFHISVEQLFTLRAMALGGLMLIFVGVMLHSQV